VRCGMPVPRQSSSPTEHADRSQRDAHGSRNQPSRAQEPAELSVRIDRALMAMLIAAASGSCRDIAAPADGPASIAVVSGDGQEAVTATGSQNFTGLGRLSDSLRVRVTNAAGAPVRGARVTWTTGAGSVSPSITTTDSLGTAAAQWSWYSPETWYVAPGEYRATALVGDVDSVTFTGYARVGVVLRELEITPDTVMVESGPATVMVRLRATDDRTAFGLEYTSVQFFSPPDAIPAGWLLPLTMISGTPADGVWEGSITIPTGTHPGDWDIIRVSLGWGCGGANRVELIGAKLTSLGLPLTLHVKVPAGAEAARSSTRELRMLPPEAVQPITSTWAAAC
jgi:hypothetical protein